MSISCFYLGSALRTQATRQSGRRLGFVKNIPKACEPRTQRPSEANPSGRRSSCSTWACSTPFHFRGAVHKSLNHFGAWRFRIQGFRAEGFVGFWLRARNCRWALRVDAGTKAVHHVMFNMSTPSLRHILEGTILLFQLNGFRVQGRPLRVDSVTLVPPLVPDGRTLNPKPLKILKPYIPLNS